MTSPARRTVLKTAALATTSLAMPFVRGAHAAGKLSMGFWDHWVPGANDTMTRLCHEWADKEKVDITIDYITSQGDKLILTAAAEAQAKSGHDILTIDFKTWADEEPPWGTLYNYPPRHPDQIVSVACAPAPKRIANQMYVQATMTKMIAHCTQGGEPISKAVDWAGSELEGFARM